MSNSKQVAARMQALDTEIGRRLRHHRQRAKLSQKALGEALGCSFQQVQKYEAGTNHLSAPRVVLAAEALGISPLGLLIGGGEVNEKPETLNNPVVQLAASLPPHKQHFALKMLRHLHDL